MGKYRIYIVFVLIFVLGLFLRFYNLSTVPNGLQQDESSIGYNAYSILETGRDEYGKYLPASFKAFGEYKLPLSIYLTTVSFAVLGVSEFSLRLPSALFGVLTVGLMYFLGYLLFNKKSIGLIAMGFFAINPWHIHFSRGAYEVTPALFFITLGFLLFILFINKNSIILLSSSLAAFALSIYGYNISRTFVPFFLILLFIIFYKKIIKLKRRLIIPIVLSALLLLPFGLTLFTSGGYDSVKGTLIPTSAVVQASNLETRSYITDQNPLIAKLFFNKASSDVISYSKNVTSYISGDFLFGTGSKHGNHGIGNVGQFYIWEILTIIVGIVFLIRSSNKYKVIVFGWVAGIILIASLTREAPQATRSFFMVIPFAFLSSYGALNIYEKIISWPRKINIVMLFGCFFSIIFMFFYYFASYFYKFPIQYAKEYRSEDKELTRQLQEIDGNYDEIFIDNQAGVLYSSIVFYSKFSPSDFQKSVTRAMDDSEGFSRVVSFGKYQYINPESINTDAKYLLISNVEKPGFKVVGKIFYPKRPVVIAKGQDIVSFPVTDIAYVLLEKN